MRRRFQELLTEEMAKNENIVLLVGDVGYKVFDHLREDYPDRVINPGACLLYTSPSPRDYAASRMPSSA